MGVIHKPESISDAANAADEELRKLLGSTENEDSDKETPEIIVDEENKKENIGESEKETIGDAKPKEIDRTDEKDIWFERYKQINGKYLNEVPRMAGEIRELKKDKTLLEEQIKVLTSKMSSAGVPETNTINEDGLSEEFGISGAEKINKYLDKRVKELESKFESKLKPFETGIENIKTDQVSTARERYVSNLDRMAPNWRKYDTSQEFSRWLDGSVEKYSGQSFKQILADADRQMNASTVATMIIDYEKNMVNSKTENSEDKKKELEKMVAPIKTGSGGVSKDNTPAKVSVKTIEKFYDDIKHGKFQGSEQDKKRLENLYDQALYEGRVAP